MDIAIRVGGAPNLIYAVALPLGNEASGIQEDDTVGLLFNNATNGYTFDQSSPAVPGSPGAVPAVPGTHDLSPFALLASWANPGTPHAFGQLPIGGDRTHFS